MKKSIGKLWFKVNFEVSSWLVTRSIAYHDWVTRHTFAWMRGEF